MHLLRAFVLAAAGMVSAQSGAWSDGFERPDLDADWVRVSSGDFNEQVVDIVDGRLRIRADTMGTDDSTVKYLGVRTATGIAFDGEAEVRVDLDWNDQTNGSYLTSGMILSPHATEGNPLDSPDWLRIEYVGVPPGINGRIALTSAVAGRVVPLYTEGWPQQNRAGRRIGLQRLRLHVTGRQFELFENLDSVFQSQPDAIPFDSVYLYLQISSHSNYRAREVFFDNVQILP
jgi:hypothetical protein